MGRFVKGQVVVLPFPFSDLSDAKRRPALVLAPLAGDDLIVCQITTVTRADSYAIPLVASSLHHPRESPLYRRFTPDYSYSRYTHPIQTSRSHYKAD